MVYLISCIYRYMYIKSAVFVIRKYISLPLAIGDLKLPQWLQQ